MPGMKKHPVPVHQIGLLLQEGRTTMWLPGRRAKHVFAAAYRVRILLSLRITLKRGTRYED